MSVYNGEEHLREAVDSVIAQTFADFEFLIVDDGSTDQTREILESYDDARIRLIEQENRGLVRSLNRALEEAKGEYVARMDADDVSLPERFSSQVAYLDEHPEVGILGTKVVYIDGTGEVVGAWEVPTLPGEVGWQLFFGTCLAHPSVMMRRELVLELGSYDGEAQHAEDYDLWARAASMTKLANLESPQVQRRGWEGSVTQRYPEIQEETVRRVLRSSDRAPTRSHRLGRRRRFAPPVRYRANRRRFEPNQTGSFSAPAHASRVRRAHFAER